MKNASYARIQVKDSYSVKPNGYDYEGKRPRNALGKSATGAIYV